MRRREIVLWASGLIFLGIMAGCSSLVQRPAISQDAVQVERDRQIDLALNTFQKRYERLMSVFYPLQIANAELCGEGTAYVSGFTTHSKRSYPDNFQENANRLHRFDGKVLIRYVHPQSSAQRAGLAAGDRIIAIEGEDVEQKDAEAVIYLLETAQKKSGRLNVTVSHEGNTRSLAVEAVRGCDVTLDLVNSDAVNAAVLGSDIQVSSGMLKFTESDTELAIVLGHELAHVMLGHSSRAKTVGKLMAVALFGYVAQKVVADSSKQNELDADYVGLYMTTRAGHDVSGASEIWRRIAIENPQSIERRFIASHPDSPERFVALEAAIKEIREKKEKGSALLPEKPAESK